MKSRNSQAGFHIIEVLLVVTVFGLIGYLGYTYYSQSQKANDTSGSGQVVEQSPVANDVVSAPTIKSTTDLTKAEKVLDDTNLDSNSDSSQLDAQLINF